MIVAFLLAAAALVVSVEVQPTFPSNKVTTQNGRLARVRILNTISGLSNTDISGTSPANAFPSASPTLTAAHQLGDNAAGKVPIPVQNSLSLNSFTEVEVQSGSSNSITITLQGGSGPFTFTCSSSQIQAGEFATFILSNENVVAPTTGVAANTCSAAGNACQTVATPATRGSVVPSCTRISDFQSFSANKDCAQFPLRIYNFLKNCNSLPVRFERSDLTASGTVVFDTTRDILQPSGSQQFATTTVQVPRDAAQTFKFATSTVLTGEREARFAEAVITSGGVFSTVTSVNTAFLNVVNLAYRTINTGTITETRSNDFTIVIYEGASVNRQKAVHVQTLNAAQASGWIELPITATVSTQYTVQLFADAPGPTAIFGDRSLAAPTAATAIPLATSPGTIDLTASNAIRLLRIVSNANNLPSFLEVPFNGFRSQSVASPPAGTGVLDFGSRKVSTWYNLATVSGVTVQPVSFVSVSGSAAASSCTRFGGAVNTNGKADVLASGTSIPVVVRNGDSGCLVSCADTFTTFSADTAASTSCELEAKFLIGLAHTRTDAVCLTSVTGTNPTTCSTSSASTTTATIVSPLTSSNTLVTNIATGSDLLTSLGVVSFCKCNSAPTPAPCTLNTCDIKTVIDGINASNSAGFSTINSGLNTVRSAVTAASTASSADADDIIDSVSTVRTDIKKIRKEIKDLEKDIKDLE